MAFRDYHFTLQSALNTRCTIRWIRDGHRQVGETCLEIYYVHSVVSTVEEVDT